MLRIVLAILLISATWAQTGVRDKIVTADPDPRSPGSFELQLNYLSSQSQSAFDDFSQVTTGQIQREQLYVGSLGYGLSQDLDLTLTSGASQLLSVIDPDRAQTGRFLGGPRRGGGLVDLELDLRWRFYNDSEQGLAMAVVGGPTLANDVKTNQGFVGGDIAFVLRQDWGPASLNWESYALFPLAGPGQRFSAQGTNLGLGYQLNSQLQPVVELNYARIQSSSEGLVQSLATTVGLVAQPWEWCKLSLGWQQTLWGTNTEKAGSLIGGLSFSL